MSCSVSSGLTLETRFASRPTRIESELSKNTTEGVVDSESELSSTSGRPNSSITATAEYVVPRSIPRMG